MMKRVIASIVACAVGGTLVSSLAIAVPAGWPKPPPPALKRPVVDDYAGTKVTDNYRYFEDLKSPVVQAYFKAENAYARAVLAKLEPGRGKLLERITALSNAGSTVTNVQRDGDYYFYEKREPGENTLRLFVRHSGSSEERVLVDPAKLVTKAAQHYSLEYYLPSLDGKYVGYGATEGGSEAATLRIVNTETGAVLPDAIDRTKYVGITSWLDDGTSFYYLRFPKLPPNAPPEAGEEKPVSYLHVLGTDPDKDTAVLGYGIGTSTHIEPIDFPAVTLTPASPYAIADIGHGVQNEQTLYVKLAKDVPDVSIPWTKIVDVPDAVTSYDLKGATIYLLSHLNASNYKVLAMSLASPDIAQAKPVVAPSETVVEQIGVAQDGLYVRSRTGGFSTIQRYALADDGTPAAGSTAVTLPFPGAIGNVITDPRVAGATFDLQNWLTSYRYFVVDATGSVTDTGIKTPNSIDTSPYTSSEELATSPDGTKVPISIIFPKNIARDGSHPAYLEGYGSYGITITPAFLGSRLAWVEHGGVYAVCHVRGGGWFGEDWHNAGKIATKQHTIDDFVACGRYLVAQKYTAPAHLAGEGTSAGGITIGRSITQHPELFAAALSIVGVSDAVRSEFSSNGPPNIPEFGSVKVASQVGPLINMDAYLNVKPGTKYPAVMLNTGINDPRVSPWELAKFTAALQAASTSGRPILLRVDYDAGHGFMATTRSQANQLLADQYSFLLWQLGDPLFAGLPKFIAGK
jgi:prolyl oligopeptidase